MFRVQEDKKEPAKEDRKEAVGRRRTGREIGVSETRKIKK